MSDIREILNLDQWPDLMVMSNGYEAKRRIDVAPLAYEIAVNKPLRAEVINMLVEFAGKADAELTRRLFELCNGIRIGATKFAVYGFPSAIEPPYFPPFDINHPNIYGRPVGWPEDYLIVGTGWESSATDGEYHVLHAITPDHRIIVAKEDYSSEVLRQYRTVASWLSAEVDRAISDRNRY